MCGDLLLSTLILWGFLALCLASSLNALRLTLRQREFGMAAFFVVFSGLVCLLWWHEAAPIFRNFVISEHEVYFFCLT